MFHSKKSVSWPILGLLLTAAIPDAQASSSLQGDYLPAHCTTTTAPEIRVPQLVTPVHSTDTKIRVINQSDGATISVRQMGGPDIVSGLPTKDNAIFNLGTAVGTMPIRVCQTHTLPSVSTKCGDWQVIKTPPAALPSPEFVDTAVLTGDQAVSVANTYLGAEVIVYANGVEESRRWSGRNTALDMPIDSTLPAGTVLTIQQRVGGVVSASNTTTIGSGVRIMHPPRVMGPVRAGDTAVWVSGMTPASLVEIRDPSGTILGSKRVGESISKIPVCPVSTAIEAKVSYGGTSILSSPELLSALPAAGSYSEYDDDLGITVDTPSQDDIPLKMRVYEPASTQGIKPVVFMMHGANLSNTCAFEEAQPNGTTTTLYGEYSYRGYEYLAQELAKRGTWVFSIKVEPNALSVSDGSRVILLDAFIENILTSGSYSGVSTQSPVGLFGHSLGGDTVLIYGSQNPDNYNLKGVVSVAPTAYGLQASSAEKVDAPKSLPLLYVVGSEDYLLNDPDPEFKTVHQFDVAENFKSAVVIRGAGHDCFNSCWCANDLNTGSLSEADHQAILTQLSMPFFYGLMAGSSQDWEPYFEGSRRPKGLHQFDYYQNYQTPNHVTLFDNFGDLETNITVEDQNLNATINALGGPVSEVSPTVAVAENTHATWAATLTEDYEALHLSDNYTARLEWGSSSYRYSTQTDLGDSVSANLTGDLSFRALAIGGAVENDVGGSEGLSQDLMVEISDGFYTARVRAGAVGGIEYPKPNVMADYHHIMGTVRIPLDAFKANNPAIDLTQIEEVVFTAEIRDQGKILIDDIELYTQ